MSWNSKVIWTEGMFLRPQHFQQQDRYTEALVRGRCNGLHPYDWGFLRLELDREALALGKLALRSGQGLLPDGTPFNFPDDDEPPPPLDVPDDLRNSRVLLALPLRRPGLPEADRQAGVDGAVRYRIAVADDVRDSAGGPDSSAPLEIGRARLRLLPDQETLKADCATLGVVRIVEKRPDQSVILDEGYLAPCLDCQTLPKLTGFISEILGLLHQRAEALAAIVSGAGRSGVAEINDFLLLQVINRWEPLFVHLSAMRGLHPEAFYRIGLQLAGELATFVSDSRRPPTFPPYRHDDLQTTFAPLLAALREGLSRVLEQNAIPLPLEERKYGIRVSPIHDRNLLAGALFVLAVRADVPAETLRSRFPAQVKIGPVEHIGKLVNSLLPGITLRALPVVPRQLPYHAGFTYFELERTGEYWQELDSSAAFALHVGGQFPGLQLEFWAIRE
jgi:type VI secretion system protein ImpJ